MTRLRIGLLVFGALLLAAAVVDDARLAEWARTSVGHSWGATPAGVAQARDSAAEHDDQVEAAASVAALASPAATVATDAPVQAQPYPAPAMSAAQAREQVLQGVRERDCEQAAYAMSERSKANTERFFWRWLPPEQVAVELLARRAAATRLAAGCPPLVDTPAAKNQRQLLRDRALAAARAAGDPVAQLRTWNQRSREPTAAHLAHLRTLLYDALLSGDPERIASIGLYERPLDPEGWRRDPAAHYLPIAWELVACDLGRDCGPTSLALDRMCLYQSSGTCGAASLEDALRYTTSPAIFERIQQRRQELLERIRSGQVAGMFDPPPPLPAWRGP